jgi:hypothetical protein
MKRIALIFGAFVLLMIVLVAVTSPPQDRGDSIKAACERQFPADEQAQTACFIGLAERTLDNDRADKMREAAREAGVR